MGVTGVSHCDTASTLDGSTATPSPEITWPRKLTSFNQNSHFDNLANITPRFPTT